MKKFIVTVFALLAVLLCPIRCFAEETTDIYDEQLNQLGVEDLSENLPDEANDYLKDFDLSDPITSAYEIFNAENIFDIILDFFKNNVKTPMTSGLIIISILLFSAAAGNIYSDNKTLQFCVSVGIVSSALLPAVSVITACADAIKVAGGFIMSFIPVFAAVIAAKGKPLTSAGFSGVMTVCVQAVTHICSFFLVPLSCMQLALGLSSSVSNDIKPLSLSQTVRKISTFSLSLVCTVFLSVLGIQTAINSPADNIYSKTAKFLIGNAVPVVGNVVAESLNTVRGTFQLLGSSVAVYGIAAVVIIALPVIAELIVWRLVMLVCGAVAELLGQINASMLIKTVDQSFAFVLGITVLVIVMFIISVGIVSVV